LGGWLFKCRDLVHHGKGGAAYVKLTLNDPGAMPEQQVGRVT